MVYKRILPVMVNAVYNTDNVNAGNFADNMLRSAGNAGCYLNFGGAGAVPVMNLKVKFRLVCGSARNILAAV